MTHCKLSHNSLLIESDGRVSHCCSQDTPLRKFDWSDVTDINQWYREEPWLKEVRDDLDAGVQHKACEWCWFYENRGEHSKRENGIVPTDITFLDLRLTNKCNLKCKMCYSGCSDQISDVVKELGDQGVDVGMPVFDAPTTTDHRKIIDLIKGLPALRTIRFAGGEPFIMPEVKWCLEALIEARRIDIHIEFITNCTVIKSDIIKLLEQFPLVTMYCSIDGVGDLVEYQRFPCKWEVIERNFRILYDHDSIRTVITPVISMLTISGMADFLEWCMQFPENNHLGFSEVTRPSHMNYRYVPIKHRVDSIMRIKEMDLPDFFQVNWTTFKERGMYEYVDIPQSDSDALKKAALWWDFECKEPFAEKFPWAGRLLGDGVG